jgi:hypothetical protein
MTLSLLTICQSRHTGQDRCYAGKNPFFLQYISHSPVYPVPLLDTCTFNGVAIETGELVGPFAGN